MNFASAVYGALAVGLTVWLGARLFDSLLAGLGAGLFLAFSYTFWSQAVTAEVYTLHLLIFAAATIALIAWADRPSAGKLAVFYGIYAIGFGNHLSMVLLLPAFALFLLMHRRVAQHGDPLRPPLIALALGIAFLGALQYAWNFRGLWTTLEPPSSFSEGLGKFWFDVTKADWRETLVMSVSETGLQTRPAMYWFDLRQQVGLPGVFLACIGFVYAMARWPRRSVLLALLFATNMAFAWTYNVGDAYIFFLPSHYVIALWAGAGLAAAAWTLSRIVSPAFATSAATLLLLYPVWRGYDTFPAVDRSWDTRAESLLSEFTAREDAAYGVDTNWQIQNAFEYFMKSRRPHVPWFATEELPWVDTGALARLVDDNHAIGREVIITPHAYRKLHARGNPSSSTGPDDFMTRVRALPPGAPYVLGMLRPDWEFPIDNSELAEAWAWLTGGSTQVPEPRNFVVVAGHIGEAPMLFHSADEPYRVRARLASFDLDIRMTSWLPTDTIRRAGFGHVIVDRKHALTLERGLSFVALVPGGYTAYGASLFAPIPRLRLGIRDEP